MGERESVAVIGKRVNAWRDKSGVGLECVRPGVCETWSEGDDKGCRKGWGCVQTGGGGMKECGW